MRISTGLPLALTVASSRSRNRPPRHLALSMLDVASDNTWALRPPPAGGSDDHGHPRGRHGSRYHCWRHPLRLSGATGGLTTEVGQGSRQANPLKFP